MLRYGKRSIIAKDEFLRKIHLNILLELRHDRPNFSQSAIGIPLLDKNLILPSCSELNTPGDFTSFSRDFPNLSDILGGILARKCYIILPNDLFLSHYKMSSIQIEFGSTFRFHNFSFCRQKMFENLFENLDQFRA